MAPSDLSLGSLLVFISAAALSCNGDSLTRPATSGTLEVSTATTGADPDPDGYTFQIDGGTAQPIGVTATGPSVAVSAGDHSILLAGIAANCAVSGDDPHTVTITPAGTVAVRFAVVCTATVGNVLVTTATTGSLLDPDGYALSIDGGTAQPIGINATLKSGELLTGSHSIMLSGIATNCHVTGANPATVTIASGAWAPVAFTLECLPTTPNDYWTSKQAMPMTGSAQKAATINGTIYAVGGLTSVGLGGAVTAVEAYDVATNTWAMRAPLPSPLEPNDVSVIDGRLYVAGGWTGAEGDYSLTKALYVYDPISDSWTRKADLPRPVGCGAQGVIGGLLYVYSGCSTRELFRYSPATNTWVTRRAPAVWYYSPAAGVIDGKLYLGNGALSVYDPATDTWVNKAPPLQALAYPAGAALGGKFYLAGGATGMDSWNLLQVYDPATDSWSSKAPMPTALWSAASAVANGQLFVMGGGTTVVQAYTP